MGDDAELTEIEREFERRPAERRGRPRRRAVRTTEGRSGRSAGPRIQPLDPREPR